MTKEMSFGAYFKKLRHEKNRTLLDVKKILGLAVSQISDIENERRRALSPSLIGKFVAGLGLGPDEERELIRLANLDRESVEIRTAQQKEVKGFERFAYSLARYTEEGKDLSDIEVDWEVLAEKFNGK